METRREGTSDSREDQDELVITRVLDAAKKEVWREWTEPERMSRWMGPKGFTSPINKMDLKVGGKYVNCMRSPDGLDFCSAGEYKEIVPEEKLVMTDSFSDKEGNRISPAEYGMREDWPQELLVTTTLEETEDGKTKMTLRHSGLSDVSMKDRKDMENGWQQSFDKMEKDLKERKDR